jgi:flagellar protein FliL
MKNRMLTMIIIILIAITLILTAAVFAWNYIDKQNNPDNPAAVSTSTPKPLTTKEMKENTIFVKDILTNLSTPDNVVSISLAFEVENKKTKEDFENLLDSVVQSTIISILNDTTIEEINGAKGTDAFVSNLMNRLNPLFKNGKIKRIDVTKKVIS